MQNSFTGLNNLCDQVIKTMKLPGRGMSLWLIIILDAGGVTKAWLYSNKEPGKHGQSLGITKPHISK